MGQELLVERHLDDGEQLLMQLQQDGYPYSAAAWFHEDNSEQWYFYIVTELVDSEGKQEAYSRLNVERAKLPNLSLDLFDFRVFSPTSRVGLGLKPYVAHLGLAPVLTHFRHIDFDRGLSGEAWVYPRDLQPAFGEWSQEVNAGRTDASPHPNAVPIFQDSA